VTSQAPGADPIEAAWAQLRRTVADARSALDRVRARPTITPEERRELQREALSGALGSDMRRLARHVDAGQTTWADVFDGISPYTHLIRGHLARMADVHAEAVRRQLEAEDFDALATHEDV
jgi:hypothetical protein